jgi:hypothetical protein
MTPLAIALVLSGVFFGDLDSMNGWFAVIIVTLSAVMNVTSVILMKQNPELVLRIRNLRVGLNYLANFFLLYLLLPVWPDVWLLILLMAIATAIYHSLESTYIHCVVYSCALIGIAMLTGQLEGIKTWQTFIHCVTICVFGPFINRLHHSFSAPA